MNNLFKFMMGAAILSLGACSSDEPAKTPDTPAGDGDALYLTVNIKSADPGRAQGVGEGEDGTFEYGNADEHKVQNADFYFFDAEGVYVAQADVWQDGGEVSQPTPSVEYISSSVLVLRGLTEKNPPKYMVTVLNDDGTIKANMVQGQTSLDEFRNKATNWTLKANGDKNLMVMTTSSFNGDGENDQWGTTLLKADNLAKEPITATTAGVTPVEVYVERLAAKFTMTGATEYTIPVTVGGMTNPDGTPADASGDTKVKVTLSGISITTTPEQSYVTKHLADPVTTTAWDWNDPTNKRSYWCASLNYDNTDATGLLNTEFKLHTAGTSLPVYANENTKPFANLKGTGDRVKANLVTNVVFTADITINGEKAELVNYRGIYYLKNNFIEYILQHAALTQNGLNYYHFTPNAEDATKGTWEQVKADEFKLVRKDETKKNAEVKIVYADNDAVLYAKNSTTPIDGGVEALNAEIANTIGTNTPVFYNGSTYYCVPVEHLLGQNDSENFVVKEDGQYGIVRNHWYNLTIESISKLGYGVFDPDSDQTFPDPDPKKETWALAAKVNILSWKIVKQNINIK